MADIPTAGGGYGQSPVDWRSLLAGGAPSNAPAAPSPAPDEFSSMRDAIATAYPPLAPHIKKTAIQWGEPKTGGGQPPPDQQQLEFYPPGEAENPNPGQPTIELYNRKLQGQDLQDLIAADSLHHLGSVDPQSGQPVDATYRGYKQKALSTLTPGQLANDQTIYQEAVKNGGETRSFQDWMDQSRGDAYMRGHLFPGQNPGWQNYLTPQQKQILDQAKGYLTTGSAPQAAAQPQPMAAPGATQGLNTMAALTGGQPINPQGLAGLLGLFR